ncbi:lytic murein transglycosylase B [Pseudidiomarina woesei]|uniref:Lytic murein transglycosylase B n=1 Tax=Pseudidiomarina woesei TaxID=1381080 RepID=A0A0K6GXW1_9GAMM|nr:lytic murein transglycosylase B [Pseudidiomarina woesei]CUA83420.1 lytic murein transglycosylase B [Pseudidiomarina woesei]
MAGQFIVRSLLLATLALSSTLADTAKATTTSKTDDYQHQREQFVQQMVTKHNFARDQVEELLTQAQRNEAILEAIARPWEAKPWFQYYPIFLTEKRLAAGLKFWHEHQDTLARAEQHYGVPAEIIVAIIGVETFYGGYLGNYLVLDALYTLGFHYPPRSKFFRSELEQYLLLTQEEKLPATELKGSYAGAMGYGQFISSSYRHYAVDFDGDNVRDLLNNPVDAIGSVANYFAKHGWKTNQPVAVQLGTEDSFEKFVSKGLKPDQSIAELQQMGLKLPTELASDYQAKVFSFELEQGHEYWLGFTNFYVITRYNHSPLYAMAVYQFSQQLQQAKQSQQ